MTMIEQELYNIWEYTTNLRHSHNNVIHFEMKANIFIKLI